MCQWGRSFKERGLHFLLSVLRFGTARGEDAFEGLLPGGEGILDTDALALVFEVGIVGDNANFVAAERQVGDLGRGLDDDMAIVDFAQVAEGHAIAKGYAQLVAEGHLADSLHQRAAADAIGREYLTLLDTFAQGCILCERVVVVGHIIIFLLDVEQHQTVAGFLEFGSDDVQQVADAHGKAAERWWHVDIVEGAAHRVLAADGRQMQTHLCVVGTEQGAEWLAPAIGVIAELLEILLECESHAAGIATGGSNLGHRVEHGVDGSVEGAPAELVGVEAIGHNGHRVALAVEQRQFANHRLGGCQLVATAEGHHHAAGTDGAIEHLDKALLRAYVEVGEGVEPKAFYVGINRFIRLYRLVRHSDRDGGLLMGTVGVDEAAAEVNNLLASPADDHTRFFGDSGHDGGFEVFLVCVPQHLVDILRVDDDGHTLLAFADGQLGAVEAGVFFGDLVKIDLQTVGQLADGDADAASAEVVTLLDKAGHLFAAEKALNLAFGGGVALLHFGATRCQRLGCVTLGCARSTADAVAARASTQQDDDVARVGGQSFDGTTRSGSNDGADLHTLGHIARMVYLVDKAGSQTDLVAIR